MAKRLARTDSKAMWLWNCLYVMITLEDRVQLPELWERVHTRRDSCMTISHPAQFMEMNRVSEKRHTFSPSLMEAPSMSHSNRVQQQVKQTDRQKWRDKPHSVQSNMYGVHRQKRRDQPVPICCSITCTVYAKIKWFLDSTLTRRMKHIQQKPTDLSFHRALMKQGFQLTTVHITTQHYKIMSRGHHTHWGSKRTAHMLDRPALKHKSQLQLEEQNTGTWP